jgi:hypothetical protein
MLPKNLIIFWLKYKDTDKNTLDDFDTFDDPRGEKISDKQKNICTRQLWLWPE